MVEEFAKYEIANRLATLGRNGNVSVEDFALFLHDARFPLRFYDVMVKALGRCDPVDQGQVGHFQLLASIIDQMEEVYPGQNEYEGLRDQLAELEVRSDKPSVSPMT